MNKTASIILTLGLVVAIGIVFWGGKENSELIQNIEIKDGIQYITIDAKGGYSPRISTAKAGIPTKLVVRTDGTYDCSSSLVVRAVGFQKLLPQTGETEIDLGIPEAGVPIEGVCGMGMYSFNVNFQN